VPDQNLSARFPTDSPAPKPHEIVPEALRDRFAWDELHDAAAAQIIAKFNLSLPRDRELIRELAFVRVAQSQVMRFGKYKGWLIEDVLDRDPQYLEWLASQPDFPARHPHLYQIIVENDLGPEDAPESEAAIAKHSPFGCCTCGGPAHFGYRDKASEMRWYCGEHRLAQLWADAAGASR
jgi:uncharacterized protein (DUF3820 family)